MLHGACGEVQKLEKYVGKQYNTILAVAVPAGVLSNATIRLASDARRGVPRS